MGRDRPGDWAVLLQVDGQAAASAVGHVMDESEFLGKDEKPQGILNTPGITASRHAAGGILTVEQIIEAVEKQRDGSV